MKAFFLFCLIILALTANADSIKIGYINVDKVVNNLKHYQESNNQIIKDFEPKKIELIDLFDYIKLLKNKIDTSEINADSEEYLTSVQKVISLENNFQLESAAWQQELNDKQFKLLEKIEAEINFAIKEYALSEQYDLILYDNGAYVSEKIDISKVIISNIEKLYQ